jgi:hypothetical protein
MSWFLTPVRTAMQKLYSSGSESVSESGSSFLKTDPDSDPDPET